MTPDHALIIAFGAFAGGFVSGLAGFGTALTALGIWLHVLEPTAAATLILICAVIAQVQTIPAIWREIQPARVLPFIIPGLLGVPLGLATLRYANPQSFKLAIGLLLVCFSTTMLYLRARPAIGWGGRPMDAAVGFAGGVLGGLAGLSGPAPTVWAILRGWSKDQKRSVFQSFNLSILATALLGQALTGQITSSIAVPVALALPGTLLGAWLGVRTYRRLSDRNFNDLIMAMLLISGVTLVIAAR